MERPTKVELYNDVMQVFGYGHLMHKAVEEMAELTNALMKHSMLRAKREDVISEIADVVICMEQLALYFGVNDVMAEKDRKLERLEERLAKIKVKIAKVANDGGATDSEGAHEREGDGEEQPKTAADGNEESNDKTD